MKVVMYFSSSMLNKSLRLLGPRSCTYFTNRNLDWISQVNNVFFTYLCIPLCVLKHNNAYLHWTIGYTAQIGGKHISITFAWFHLDLVLPVTNLWPYAFWKSVNFILITELWFFFLFCCLYDMLLIYTVDLNRCISIILEFCCCNLEKFSVHLALLRKNSKYLIYFFFSNLQTWK